MASTTSTDDVRETWDAVSAAWDEHHDRLAAHTRPVTERMIELLDAQPGETVLDVAAGLGELSHRLAPLVGAQGKVICSDVAPGMVRAAEQRSGGTSELDFEQLDAHDLDLDDDSVDAVVCKMGLMLFDDAPAAAAECRRVLRPDGRFVAATWGSLEDNAWITLFGGALLAQGHDLPGDPHDAGGIFSLSSPSALTQCLRTAGFEHVEVEAVAVPDTQASFDDYWRLRRDTGGPLTVLLDRLPDDQVNRVHETCEQYAAGFRRPEGGYVFPGRALVAVAR